MELLHLKFKETKKYNSAIHFNLALIVLPMANKEIYYKLEIRKIAKKDFTNEGNKRINEIKKKLKTYMPNFTAEAINDALLDNITAKINFRKSLSPKMIIDTDLFVDLFAYTINQKNTNDVAKKSSVTPNKDGLLVLTLFVKKGKKSREIAIKKYNPTPKKTKIEFILNTVTKHLMQYSILFKKYNYHSSF